MHTRQPTRSFARHPFGVKNSGIGRSRILVVEDEPDVRDLIVEILEREGYDVQTASTGREAIALLARHAYDLILTDLQSPAILITGHTHARDYERSLTEPTESEGFMLPKPFTPESLRQVVRQALAMPERPSTP